ncbi:DUF4381 domain-containing protein [Microbulbifer elongatus]|uniref:DUF4381 domain-containing protein n=1 Tax=Microbulbifer elongatus TaxID=86173 RepID=UPI001E6133BF|nr:DUF4381 domain-containing protein [Microbulbifer elongatus]
MQENKQEMVTLYDLIVQIKEPPPPDAISLWPQTPGTWLLVAILLGALVYAAWRAYRRHQADAYRRAARAEIAQNPDDPAQLAEVLRRTALVAYPRPDVAALIGEDWIAFLNQKTPRPYFDDRTGTLLTSAPYRATTGDTEAISALRHGVQQWIDHHKPERTVDQRLALMQGQPVEPAEASP